jgi:hypothetical protein
MTDLPVARDGQADADWDTHASTSSAAFIRGRTRATDAGIRVPNV